jgi:hypothetical protein
MKPLVQCAARFESVLTTVLWAGGYRWLSRLAIVVIRCRRNCKTLRPVLLGSESREAAHRPMEIRQQLAEAGLIVLTRPQRRHPALPRIRLERCQCGGEEITQSGLTGPLSS